MDARRHREQERSLPVGLPVNPPGTLLGVENAVLTGTNNRHFVSDFEGCFSIKTVVRGSALWEAGGRIFKVHENSYLTLNDRQRYTLTIDSLQNATTFCLFFERGFVEDVFRATATRTAGLLDAPQPHRQLSVEFTEKLEPGNDRVMAMVRDLNARIGSGPMMRTEWDERFLRIDVRLHAIRLSAASETATTYSGSSWSARLACGRASFAEVLNRFSDATPRPCGYLSGNRSVLCWNDNRAMTIGRRLASR